MKNRLNKKDKSKKVPKALEEPKKLKRSIFDAKQALLYKGDNLIINDNKFLDYILGDGNELSLELKNKIVSKLDSIFPKAHIYLTAHMQKSINRVAKLIDATDVLEEELFTRERLEGSETKDLVGLLKVLIDEKNTNIDNIQSYATTGFKSMNDMVKKLGGEQDTKDIISNKIKQLPVNSRERLLTVANKVSKNLKNK